MTTKHSPLPWMTDEHWVLAGTDTTDNSGKTARFTVAEVSLRANNG